MLCCGCADRCWLDQHEVSRLLRSFPLSPALASLERRRLQWTPRVWLFLLGVLVGCYDHAWVAACYWPALGQTVAFLLAIRPRRLLFQQRLHPIAFAGLRLCRAVDLPDAACDVHPCLDQYSFVQACRSQCRLEAYCGEAARCFWLRPLCCRRVHAQLDRYARAVLRNRSYPVDDRHALRLFWIGCDCYWASLYGLFLQLPEHQRIGLSSDGRKSLVQQARPLWLLAWAVPVQRVPEALG